MATVLITGANGFVGSALGALLIDSGYSVKGAIRDVAALTGLDPRIAPVIVGNIQADTDWQAALDGVNVVIHLAARVHVMHETADDALQAFCTVNTAGTAQLAQQAALVGVKRFIFLSSIKVLGEATQNQVFDQNTPVAPNDPYAHSKCLAEQRLGEIGRDTGMQIVVVRPPLVYGAGVKGNFLRLMQLVKKGWPLPLACVKNQRSMVYVENLCALLVVCVTHPAANGQTFLCADSEAYSTPELIKQLASAMGGSIKLWPVPVWLLKGLANVLNKRAEMARLCDALVVDASETYRQLNWQPPFTIKQGITKTVAAFKAGQG